MTNSAGRTSLLQRIWSAAAKDQDKCIVLDANKAWTWRELLWRGQSYADALGRIDASDDHTPIVPILVERTGETVAAILGALMAGRGFSPLSSQQPRARLNHCFAALGAKAVFDPGLAGDDFALLRALPESKLPLSGLPPEPPPPEWESILYVLFTSGSTGVPKGVMADFRNIENTMLWSMDMLDWHKDDVIGCCTNFYFDISMFDVFTTFYFDVPLAIYSHPADVAKVVEQTAEFRVTSAFGVPTFFSQILRHSLVGDARLSSIRRIIAGGDFFPPAHVIGWLDARPDIDLYNVWGPTETSIVNTMHRVGEGDMPCLASGLPAPVGKAHPRMPFCLVDESMNLVEGPNLRGEICMLGACVTRGYLGDVERTAQAYVEIVGERAFRTQDIGYLDESGRLFIVGRMGSTVKVSGYRIDLGEVDAAATALSGVHLACAFVVEPEHDSADRELWLAIEPKDAAATLDVYSLKKRLRASLPPYMVPKRVLIFPELPRNSNGKVDRRATLQTARGEAGATS